MSDTTGRPIMVADPTQPGRKLIEGSPVIISNWMLRTGHNAGYKFDARVGGNTTCPNASRLMRIR